jgi:hypothetical protein
MGRSSRRSAKGDGELAGNLMYEHAMESRERLHAALEKKK